MYFQLLQRRLIEAMRRCIGNGLLTERGLARWAGISQPHLHHMLKGMRSLSPEMADRILRALQLTVMDLLELAEREARPGGGLEAGVPQERIQILVDQARALREEALLPPDRVPLPLSAGGPWPLPGRSPAPGAPRPPN